MQFGNRPRSIPEGVAAIREWEYKYGPAAKVFMRKPEVFFDKKLNFPLVAQVKGEPEKSLAQGMDKVKLEKDWSSARYGQYERRDFKCYGCGETGHMKRNCPKAGVRKVEATAQRLSFELEGYVQGSREICMLDTGSDMTLIPERLAKGLPREGVMTCRAVGGDFQADKVDVHLRVGSVDRKVQAAVVPDSYIFCPLIGMNIGIDEIYEAIGVARQAIRAEQEAKIQAVQTRNQCNKEEQLELEAARTRKAEKPAIQRPEQLKPVITRVEEAEETTPAESETETVDTSSVEEDGEQLVASVTSVVDADKNVGLVLPSMEIGAGLAAEYKGALEVDESLKEWKLWAREQKNGFRWDQGVLKRSVEDELRGDREMLVVPEGMRMRMLGLVHDQLGHVGSGKMLWALRQSCCWPGMSGSVKRYGRSCGECQKMRKGGLAEVPMGEMPIHRVPFENVSIDIVGPFPRSRGYRYLLTYICLASRYPEAIPLKHATAKECAEALMEIFSRNGVPMTMLSDQGTQFMGVLMKCLCERLGVRQIRTTPYHPQSNGSVERMHGTLVPMLRKLASKDLPWDDQVKFALYAIRATPNRSTGFAPFEAIHGRLLRSPLDVIVQEIDPVSTRNVKAVEWLSELNKRVNRIPDEMGKNIERAQCERKERHDKHAVVRKFSVGEKVLTRVPGLKNKLEGSWEGPFVVLDVPSEVHVVLGTPDKACTRGMGKRVHINSCKPFHEASVYRVAVWATDDELLDKQMRLQGGELSQQQKEELEKLLGKWGSMLRDEPGETELVEHDIDTGDAQPVRAAPYQLPDKWKDAVREELCSLKELGILVPSNSPWGSPRVPVAKKDGSVRVCVDFRRVNRITVQDPYHIPLVSEIVGRVGNSKFLSKLDLNKGFY